MAQERAQSRYLGFDRQAVPSTGFKTLFERFWEPLISVVGGANPQRALRKLELLTSDELGVGRATVAGILFCTDSPQEWLPQAVIMATMYRVKIVPVDSWMLRRFKGRFPFRLPMQ